MADDRRYWFPAKRYGWGWGPPSTWQGWIVLAVFAVLLGAGGLMFPPGTQTVAFLAFTAILVALLIAICWLTGEPPRWRWGNDGTADR